MPTSGKVIKVPDGFELLVNGIVAETPTTIRPEDKLQLRRLSGESTGVTFRMFEGPRYFQVESLVEELEDEVTFLTPAERVLFFDKIEAPWCRGCGEPQPKTGRKCQCRNDE